MNANAIPDSHKVYFLQTLEKLGEGPELDLSHIRSRLAVLEFPNEGESIGIAASGNFQILLPYQAMAVISSFPNHLSDDTRVLEYWLTTWPMFKSPESHLLYYSVFPNGRLVAGVPGAVLDTADRITSYESGVLIRARAKVQNPRALRILEQAIKSFPRGSNRVEICRAAILGDLQEALPQVSHSLN